MTPAPFINSVPYKPILAVVTQCLIGVALLFVEASGLNPILAQEISYFRKDIGSSVDGKQRALPSDFNVESKVAWKTTLDSGISTPCVYGDAIFLTSYLADKKELATLAIDRTTGAIRWKKVAPTQRIEPFHQTGSPASSTPACDGERLYVFFGSYGLLCYDLKGNEVWHREMGPFQDEFGASSSPVLAGDKLLLNEDHDINCSLTALDKRTGKTVWTTPRDGFTRSYSTPVVWNGPDGPQVIVAGSLQLTAYDLSDGKVKWYVRGLSRIVDTTPVIVDETLYVATWTPGGDAGERIEMEPFAGALKQFDADGDGKIAKTELKGGPVAERFFRIDLNQDEKLDQTEWEKHAKVFELAQNVAMAVQLGGTGDVTQTHVKWIQQRGLPTVPSPCVYDGIVYMVKDGGVVTSLDARTGQILKQGRSAGRGNYYASLIAADHKVFLASEGGVLTVLDAAKDWTVKSSYDFRERIMATPVIADGQFFVRTDAALYCFERK